MLVWDACPHSQQLVHEPRGTASYASFGRTGDYQATPVEDGGLIRLKLSGKFAGAEAVVRATGEFNATNATAALATAAAMGVTFDPRVLAEFPGVRRRQTVLSAGDGPTVLEDYAHHPAEIGRAHV